MSASVKVVERGAMIYLRGATPKPGGDVKAQTRRVLERIDRLLAAAGSDRSKLLTAQVRLKDMADFEAHDAVWNDWVDRARPPLRACAQAELPHPGMRVEITVTATRR